MLGRAEDSITGAHARSTANFRSTQSNSTQTDTIKGRREAGTVECIFEKDTLCSFCCFLVGYRPSRVAVLEDEEREAQDTSSSYSEPPIFEARPTHVHTLWDPLPDMMHLLTL